MERVIDFWDFGWYNYIVEVLDKSEFMEVMFMKVKVLTLLLLSCIICFCFLGCKETEYTLNVVSSYSGWGEDGSFLGSGSFSESFSVSSGDELFEDYGGHWNKDNTQNYDMIIKIKEINDSGVIIQLDEEEISMQYNSTKHIDSRYVVSDGTNYEYSISFSQE